MITALARLFFRCPRTTVSQTPPPELPVPFPIGARIKYLDRPMVVTSYSYAYEYMPKCLIAHYWDTDGCLHREVFEPVTWPALVAENNRGLRLTRLKPG